MSKSVVSMCKLTQYLAILRKQISINTITQFCIHVESIKASMLSLLCLTAVFYQGLHLVQRLSHLFQLIPTFTKSTCKAQTRQTTHQAPPLKPHITRLQLVESIQLLAGVWRKDFNIEAHLSLEP